MIKSPSIDVYIDQSPVSSPSTVGFYKLQTKESQNNSECCGELYEYTLTPLTVTVMTVSAVTAWKLEIVTMFVENVAVRTDDVEMSERLLYVTVG